MRKRLRAVLLCVALAVVLGLTLAFALVWPAPTGEVVSRDGKLTLDLSGVAQGYFMAAATPGSKPYKLRVRYGETTMTYALNNSGDYEIIPLQFGSGAYSVSLYESAGGQKYASAGAVRIDATLMDENAAALVPSQYVNYAADSRALALSNQICAGKQTDQEKLDAIRAYVREHYGYDFIRTFSITTETLPDIEYCASGGMGMYLDLAAMTACMLRVQGIPTRFVVGMLDKQEHAWNVVLLNGQEILYDPSVEIGGVRGTHYAMERFY